MKKVATLFLSCCFLCMGAEPEENKEKEAEITTTESSKKSSKIVVQEIKTESRDFPSFVAKTFHADSVPNFQENKNVKVEKKEIPLVAVPHQDRTKIAVDYLHNCCMVTDTRTIKAKRGLNKIRFERIIPCDISSVTLRTPSKGKINVRSYSYNPPISSYNELLHKFEGESVGDRNDKRKIALCMPLDKYSSMVISSNKSSEYFARYQGAEFFSATVSCAAIDAMYSLDVLFESDTTEEIELEICYTTSAITQQCAYDVDIFEKLDRVDVYAKSILDNTTGIDIKNAIISVKKDFLGNLVIGLQNDIRIDGVNLSKYNQAVCVFPCRNAQHSVTYRAKISQNDLEMPNRDPLDKNPVSLTVKNLVTLDNIGKNVAKSKEFEDSLVSVYYRQGESRELCNQFKLSDVRERDWTLEIGETGDIIAKYQRIDRTESAKNQLDYGFKVSLQNNKAEDASVNVFIDIDTEKYKILRSNIEPRNGEWIIPLKAGESKELQIRMRVEK